MNLVTIVFIYLIGRLIFKLIKAAIAKQPRPTKPPSKITPQGLIPLAGVAGIIVAFEYVSPSSRLTGYIPKPSITPALMLPDRNPIATPNSFEDLAGSADWLWPLAKLSEQDIRERLTTDIDILRTRVTDTPKDDTVSIFSYNPLVRTYGYRDYGLFADGFEHVLSKLDTFTQGAPVFGYDVDRFLVTELYDWSLSVSEERLELQKETGLRLLEFDKSGMDEKDLYANETYRTLQNEAHIAQSDYEEVAKFRSRLATHKLESEALAALIQQNQDLPAMTGIIPLREWDDDRIDPGEDTTIITGQTKDPSVWRFIQRLKDEAVGYQRSAKHHQRKHRCGLGFKDGTPKPVLTALCEASLVLPINYDITGLGCEDLTLAQANRDELNIGTSLAASKACKESWIFPHLNVAFTPETVTFFPPVPAELEATRAAKPVLSRWVVVWDQEAVNLDRPVTFPWDEELWQFETLELIHKPHPNIQKPRIWQDFRLSMSDATAVDLVQSDAYRDNRAFRSLRIKPAQLQDIASAQLEFMNFFQDKTRKSNYAFDTTETFRRRMLNALDDQIAYWKELSKSAFEGVNIFCEEGYNFIKPVRDPWTSEAIRSYASTSSDAPCRSFATASLILRYADRLHYDGSWLWATD